MPAGIRFPMVGLPGSAEELRAEVREFLSCEITEGAFSPRCDSWLGECIRPSSAASWGRGGSLSEAVAVLRLVGRHAAPVPLAETDLLAGWALSASGLPVPGGPLTAAALG
jgi:hypothetical protein